MKNRCYLMLGTNLGDRPEALLKAINLIKSKIGNVTKTSSIYETAPWGETDQPSFLNQAICVSTNLDVLKVLQSIHSIELEMGRQRTPSNRWKERTIDIDILFFNDEIHQLNELIVPHQHLHERKFTLVPLNEIAPNYVHPILEKTIGSILKELNDPLEVMKME